MRVYDIVNVSKDLGESAQGRYLKRYLSDLKAETVLVEDGYIDRDYLIDYSKFYARSFIDYEKRTKRLHFFKTDITEKKFRSYLENPDKSSDELNDSYLGFVVVKPLKNVLDQPLVGRSILKHYSEKDMGDKRYFLKQQHKASLYGLSLDIWSLPFQTQDNAVGACATAALWTCLFPLKSLFGIQIYSPVEITEISSTYPGEHRNFPSQGLTILQIINFIRKLNLEIENIKVQRETEKGKPLEHLIEPETITDIIKSYITCKLPVIGTLKLTKNSSKPDYHAIVVSGFRCDETGEVTEFYAHDDQIGPYSRIEPDGNFFKWCNAWTEEYGYSKAEILQFLVPIYPKLRLTFARIYAVYEDAKKKISQQGLEPELFLIQLNDYKNFLLKKRFEDKVNILLKPFPRFLWVIRTKINEIPLQDSLYDATAVNVKKPIQEIRYTSTE